MVQYRTILHRTEADFHRFDQSPSQAHERTRPRVPWSAPSPTTLARPGKGIVNRDGLHDVPTRVALVGTREGACAPQLVLRARNLVTGVKTCPRIGTTSEKQFAVEAAHTIDFADEHMPAVLCTPSLIWFLEHAARDAVLPCLESGESTVGINVEVSHLAATPVGNTVTCLARIIHVEGSQVSFQLEARDEFEVIAKGFHKLQIIRVDRFAARVQRKKK